MLLEWGFEGSDSGNKALAHAISTCGCEQLE